jgi:hypothetical protein
MVLMFKIHGIPVSTFWHKLLLKMQQTAEYFYLVCQKQPWFGPGGFENARRNKQRFLRAAFLNCSDWTGT